MTTENTIGARRLRWGLWGVSASLYYSTGQKHFWQKAPRHSCTAAQLYENSCSAGA
eukprot:COSAG01_NODE_11496_length_1922_cov_1.115743_1_plen_55_part_10